jgi:hypothetical protein
MYEVVGQPDCAQRQAGGFLDMSLFETVSSQLPPPRSIMSAGRNLLASWK